MADEEELSFDEAVESYSETESTDPEGQTEEEVDGDEDELEADEDLSEDDDEDEAETDDDGQADEDDEDDEYIETEQGRFVSDNGKVRMEDGSIATIRDLKDGTLRQADYTRGKMEVSEQRRTMELQTERVKQQEQQLNESQELAMAILEGLMPQQPDANMLSTDPLQYMQDKASYDQKLAQLQQVQNERQQRQQTLQAEQQQQQQLYIQKEQQALLQAIPEFKDANRYQRFVNDMFEHGQSYGYSQEELSNVADHRAYLVMRDALRYQKLQANKSKVSKKVEGRPPVQRAGKRLSSKSQKAKSVNAAKDRAKKSGNITDVTAAYLQSQKG